MRIFLARISIFLSCSSPPILLHVVPILIVLLLQPVVARGASSEAVILQVQGAIGPAVGEYFADGLQTAIDHHASVVVLEIDTPGGLDLTMRDMIQAILNSPIPVITYVYPEGARAASAGTYILYASHVAAMAPATNLGAATPVQMIGLPESGDEKKNDEEKKQDEPPHGDAMQRKIIHDAAAYIRSLANRHGRNGEWAEKAVREAVSLTAHEALQKGVIDIVATDLADLLEQVDGREVAMHFGPKVLSTEDFTPIFITPTWKTQILAVISNPNVAYLLLLLGFYGLIYELANPGFFLPGVAGAIALLLALYGFQVLPVNYSGLALLVLGIALIVSEAFVPSFGSLGIGGVIAFIIGSLILFDEEQLRISPVLIAGTTLVSAAFLFWLMKRLLSMGKQSARTGSEALQGMTGEVIENFCHNGRIWLCGESWQATCADCVKKGEKVRVVSVNNLLLTVEKLEEDR